MHSAPSGCWKDGHIDFLTISVTLFPVVYVACCTCFSVLFILILTSHHLIFRFHIFRCKVHYFGADYRGSSEFSIPSDKFRLMF